MVDNGHIQSEMPQLKIVVHNRRCYAHDHTEEICNNNRLIYVAIYIKPTFYWTFALSVIQALLNAFDLFIKS